MPRTIDADVCIIGSGFGGTLAAKPFVEAGRRVVMIERGGWVERGPQNWAPDATGDNTPFYNFESPYLVLEGGNKPQMGAYHNVGGPSVFYGAVSLRFREADFEPLPQIVGDSGAAWPFGYDEIAPWYDQAEAALDIAGTAGADPTEPARSGPFPQPSAPLADVSQRIGGAAEALGLHPFPLPLAINYRAGERQCALCPTCDTYACAISAKNDLASTWIPRLMRQGMLLLPNKVVVCLKTGERRITSAEIVDRTTGERQQVRARAFVLAAGALGSPLLALASRLDRFSPAPDAIGAYLMRHVNAIVFGLFPKLPGRLDTFHKQIGIHDF
ncbi:MAG: GMC family oxidoreductase, partial [Candidatus Dadabacteria bacterium]